jgi:hypothetical protein
MSEPLVFEFEHWGNFWNNEGGLPSDLVHGRTVQFKGAINEIWRRPYTAVLCAFCVTNKVDYTTFTVFCTSCSKILIKDKEEYFTKLRSKKRLRRISTVTRKTRSRAVASDSTDTDTPEA